MRKIFIGYRGFDSISMYSFIPMLMLPNIESIHVECLQQDDDWPGDFENLLQPASSSVQHLSFGLTSDNSLEPIVKLAVRARHLKTLMIRAQYRLLDVLEPLSASVSCLERVILHGEDFLVYSQPISTRLLETPISMDAVACFTAIQVLSINLWNIIHAWDPHELSNSRCHSDLSSTTIHGPYLGSMTRLVASLPRSLQVLILDSTRKFAFLSQDIAVIDDAFCRIIKDQLCPNLTEIYMDRWRDMYIFPTKPPCTPRLQNALLPRTAALAKDRGIEVFTYESEGATDRFISTLINEQFRV